MTSFSLWLCLLPVVSLCAAAPWRSRWLDQVAPFITAGERSAYLVLTDDRARENCIRQFWSSKQLLSGHRTDRGRMYLTLGAPHRVTRLASSRIFFPIEIWYYDGAPALRLNYQLQF